MTNHSETDPSESSQITSFLCFLHAISPLLILYLVSPGMGILIFATWIVWPVVLPQEWFRRGIALVAAGIWGLSLPFMLLVLAFMTGRT